DELVLADRAGVHAGAAEGDLGAVMDGGAEHPLEVVVAVGRLLAGERTGDRIGEEEDANLLAVALRKRVREPQPVVAALGPVCGVVEDHERPHLLRSCTVPRPAASVPPMIRMVEVSYLIFKRSIDNLNESWLVERRRRPCLTRRRRWRRR